MAWLAWDRLSSLVVTREPAPPDFAPPPEPRRRGADDLTQVPGVGPTYAARLEKAGIESFIELANAEVEWVRSILRTSERQAREIIDRARSLALPQ